MTLPNFHIYIFQVAGTPPDCRRGALTRVSRAAEEEVDPYIAALIKRLQQEVRAEQGGAPRASWRTQPRWTWPLAEAPPPLGESLADFPLPDRHRQRPRTGDNDATDATD
ncbi:MAG: hypothetical protein GTO03_00490 [Planctomycetales bacterium]|nr:hypothetical protein [Planctomycetales bacterium]